MQFQLSMALKPATTGLTAFISQLQKAYVTGFKGFDPQKMVACTLVFEGTATGVAQQELKVYKIAAQHKGMKAGAENGKRGYLLTYNIAYIRDFGIEHFVLAESFETSVPWSRVLELCERVKGRVHEEHSARKLPGKPFVTCRVTQVYDTGCAVYFYFAYFFKGVSNPSQVYAEIEKAARDEILLSGGSLSHHHGVGKLRKGFLPRIMSTEAIEWRKNIKQAIDPNNVFGCGNGV
jgi:alkyldihydroxyacetonephosphate synthase